MKPTTILLCLFAVGCADADPGEPPCGPTVVYESAAAKRCLIVTAPEDARVRVAGDSGPGSADVVLGEGESYEVLACSPDVGAATSEHCD
jgi:hypothetical protein